MLGKYQYKRPTMGISNFQEVFQHNMNVLFQGIYIIYAYIEDLLMIKKGNCKYQSEKLEATPIKIK